MSWRTLAKGARAVVVGDRDGSLVRRARTLLSERYGARDVLLTDSGTSALSLALAGASGGHGLVALPGYACYDLATAAIGAGVGVTLYDLSPTTLAPERFSLDAVGRLDLAAIVYAPLFGFGYRLPETSFGDEVLVIVDAAQGAGAEVDGLSLAAMGSVSILSFGRGKGMTAGGGGALLAHDARGEAVLVRARASMTAERNGRGARRVVALAAQKVLSQPMLYGVPAAMPFLHLGETRYHPPWRPTHCPRASLAMLELAVEDVDRESMVRVRHAERLASVASKATGVSPIVPSIGVRPGYLRLPMLLRRPKDVALDERARHLGIAAGYPQTLAEVSALAPGLRLAGSLEGARTLASSLVTLPTHSLLDERDLLGLERWTQNS